MKNTIIYVLIVLLTLVSCNKYQAVDTDTTCIDKNNQVIMDSICTEYAGTMDLGKILEVIYDQDMDQYYLIYDTIDDYPVKYPIGNSILKDTVGISYYRIIYTDSITFTNILENYLLLYENILPGTILNKRFNKEYTLYKNDSIHRYCLKYTEYEI